ncbi:MULTISPECIES: DUF6134 family protein [Acetobacterales]|uniref:DUF6134 family protein n=1 Tax=Roseomonas sp. WGS1072 TaxID=3366816 RepID=UPI003BF41766
MATGRRMSGGSVGRRGLLAALLALPGLSARAAIPPAGYRFRVLRGDSEIGTHLVRAEPDGTIRTEVALAVTMLGITVYRHAHDYSERWQGERLLGFASRTLRNGRETRLRLVATAEGLAGEGPEGALRLPAEAAPLSWWEPGRMGRPLFNAHTGRMLDGAPRRDQLGALMRWRWPEGDMAALYDAAGRWVGFTMRGDDGSAIRYEAF